MTREDKELLLKDLCVRLPYGIKIQTWYGKNIITDVFSIDRSTCAVSISDSDENAKVYLDNVKPYLRPMSSMTEEEFSTINARSCLMPVDNDVRIVNYGQLDFLNSHHFDYRGLIEKGLALEAPKGMYKI